MPIEPLWYAALTLFLASIAGGAPAGVLCAVTAFAALSQACRALAPGAGPDLAAFIANAGACALTLLILRKFTCAESSAP